MKFKNIFHILSILFVVVISIVSAVQNYQWTKSLVISTKDLPDGITQWESRLERIKEDLPGHGSVGYISDWDLPDIDESTDLETEYRLTQYALSPLVVSRGMDYPMIVANITAMPFDESLSDYFNVNIVKEYGFGIYLLEKR